VYKTLTSIYFLLVIFPSSHASHSHSRISWIILTFPPFTKESLTVDIFCYHIFCVPSSLLQQNSRVYINFPSIHFLSLLSYLVVSFWGTTSEKRNKDEMNKKWFKLKSVEEKEEWWNVILNTLKIYFCRTHFLEAVWKWRKKTQLTFHKNKLFYAYEKLSHFLHGFVHLQWTQEFRFKTMKG
jgi:hypothetical protein